MVVGVEPNGEEVKAGVDDPRPVPLKGLGANMFVCVDGVETENGLAADCPTVGEPKGFGVPPGTPKLSPEVD